MMTKLKSCPNCGGKGKITPYVDKWNEQQCVVMWCVRPVDRGRMYALVSSQQFATGTTAI